MRVNQSGNTPVQGADVTGTKQSGKSGPTHGAKNAEKSSGPNQAIERGARSEISAKGREFAQAKAVASETPDTRDDRIAELKKRITEGRYKVDSDTIADRLVDDHLRMSSS